MNQFEPYLPILEESIRELDAWRESYGKSRQEHSGSDAQIPEIREVINELAERLKGNYPFHHPQYAGQMLKPPHPVAWLSYALAMTINPNNHALDGGPPTSAMEKEIVRKLAKMVGYPADALGHLTSAGTIANLEALFVAREIHPGKRIAASENAHYTHRRMCKVLNTSFLEIPVDSKGTPDMDFIADHAGQIGTLVVTMGTTGLGFVEPLNDLMNLAQEHGIRVHADAAYGGFFKLIAADLPGKEHWDRLGECDSIVIDPHKHGLQPYGCGSVVYRDPAVGRYFKHDSPYTYFTSDELHLGEISLECSRAGASAAAFWATERLLPFNSNGLGSVLMKTRKAALAFAGRIQKMSGWELLSDPDLDIVGYFKSPASSALSEVNRLNRDIFREGMKRKESGFHLSLFTLPAHHFIRHFPDFEPDAGHAVILRSVLMKDEHLDFTDELAERLERAASRII
jgi:glutamate/tyrosine decarboxylase-like PLP-dependent enzyme